MTLELAVDIMRNLLQTGLLLAIPILGTATVVGLLVSFVQSITSLQEQTLTFVPKMVAVVVVLATLGPDGMNKIVIYMQTLLVTFPEYIK